MRVVFAGTPAPAVPSLEALIASSHEVVGVLARPDAPAGRGRKLRACPVKECALEHGIEVVTPRRLRDQDAVEALERWAPDAVAVVAYGALVREPMLSQPKHGWINLHFSLLPAWRGAAPVHYAIAAGDDMTGASTFRLDEGLDTGPVLGMMTERIRSDDTTGTLLERLATGGSHLLVATFDGLEKGELEARPQPQDGVSHAPKIEVEQAKVQWGWSAASVDRHIRAMDPFPGAWTTRGGVRLKLGAVRPVPWSEAPEPVSTQARDAAPGTLLVTRRAVLVATGDGLVELGDVKEHGKRMMAAPDWARGARIEDAEVLGG